MPYKLSPRGQRSPQKVNPFGTTLADGHSKRTQAGTWKQYMLHPPASPGVLPARYPGLEGMEDLLDSQSDPGPSLTL